MTSATTRRTQRLVSAAVVLALLGACSPTSTTAALRAAEPDYAPGWNAVAVNGTPEMPRAEFVDASGEPFNLRAAIRRKPTLVYFGYTHCPDICPIHMSSLGHVLEQFPHAVRSRVRVVFVSTDPARDSPQRIREWLDSMGRGFVGLRGTIDDINRIQIALGLPPATSSPGAIPGMDYPVGHAAQVLAFTPDDSAHFVYPFGTRQQDWMRDLPRLLNEFGTEP
jgi:protein SCO1/2